ncbi:MAG: hypothetical protein HN348_07880 [Proteobacteria bacterium]|nr:hypothetical protein [Pseudomonadota bacterium]
MMYLLWLSVAAYAGCDVDSFQDAVDSGEEAFGEMEPQRFEEAVVRADETMACMNQLLTPVHCAAYHRLQALATFFAHDDNGTVLHFQAVRATQPGYQLPRTIAPEGHPLRDSFDNAAQFLTDDSFPLPPPETGWLHVDGQRSNDAPSGRPFIFQRFNDGGSVLQTRYLPVGTPMPSYPVAEVPVSGPDRKGIKKALFWSGIGLGVAAVGIYGGAFASRGSYNRAVVDGDEPAIIATHKTTNALVGTAVGSGGVSIALVVTSIALK